MMLEIGSLVGISKAFLETFVVLKKIIGDSKGGDPEKMLTEMRDKIDVFQTRLEGLAIQLEQTERLTRMIRVARCKHDSRFRGPENPRIAATAC